jgi:hypothetical protein
LPSKDIDIEVEGVESDGAMLCQCFDKSYGS